MNKNTAKRPYLEKLGQRIREVRLDRSLSQEELADKSGVHRTYVGMIERGEKNITVLSLLKVSGALGIDISDLLDGIKDEQ